MFDQTQKPNLHRPLMTPCRIWSAAVMTALTCVADDRLIGRSVLPAATFAPGPTSGQQLGTAPINGQRPPFENRQPVQGFSATLNTGPAGTEGRKAGDDGGHTIVLTFSKELVTATATLEEGRGAIVGTTVSGNQVLIELSGVANAQSLRLALPAVTDVYGGTTTATLRFSVLRGDVDGNGVVNPTDVALVQAAINAGGTVNSATFNADVNVNGKINSADAAQTRTRRAQAEL